MPRRPRSRVRRGALLVWVLGALVLPAGCGGDRTRQMGRVETQRFKQQRLREQLGKRSLSPQQARRFLRHPARTQAELDQVLEDLEAESREERLRARMRLLEERENAGDEGGTGAGEAGVPQD